VDRNLGEWPKSGLGGGRLQLGGHAGLHAVGGALVDRATLRSLVGGGSKGIVKKNLQTVNGISLIERALKSALKSSVDKIIVSTDDLEIEK
jgi:hypothetical protein